MNFFLLLCSAAWIAQGNTFSLNPSTKEDLKAIKELQMSQKSKDLAKLISLSAEQVNKIRNVKAEVDRIKNNAESEFQEIEKNLSETAIQLRQALEQGKESQTLAQTLKKSQKDLIVWRKKMRLNLQLAALDLEGVLERDQIQTLMDHTNKRPHHQANKGKRHKKALARLLLSDAFLNQFPN